MINRPRSSARWWRYLQGLLPPSVLLAIMVGILIYAMENHVRGELEFEENILKEWVLETRVGQATLVELVRRYVDDRGVNREDRLDAVRTHLAVLGDLTRTNQGLLPLFPSIYRMELKFVSSEDAPIVWESNLPVPRGLAPVIIPLGLNDQATTQLHLFVQLRAFANRQEEIAKKQARLRHGLTLIALAAAGVALLWIALFLRRERGIELKEYRAKEQLDALERQRLQEQIRREEEEIKRQEAEKQVLEARTKLYADISVLAGSYAHNIKNLLVRPNDLLERCLERAHSSPQERKMLGEARESLRAVAERTQQILRTVRRDLEPTRSEHLDLNQAALAVGKQWRDLADQQWKADLRIEPAPEPVWVNADGSHLQQALENLLCNARDATFEQRNRMREIARTNGHGSALERQDSILAAAAWRGIVVIRVTQSDGRGVLSVEDNGMGMDALTLQRCTEAHFSTKRDNAMLEGHATGMGLGLSFVAWVIDQHQGNLKIESQLGRGTIVRLEFPLAASDVQNQ